MWYLAAGLSPKHPVGWERKSTTNVQPFVDNGFTVHVNMVHIVRDVCRVPGQRNEIAMVNDLLHTVIHNSKNIRHREQHNKYALILLGKDQI